MHRIPQLVKGTVILNPLFYADIREGNMDIVKLYRGMTVPESKADIIIEDIMQNGLYQSDKQQWGGFIWKNIKPNIKDLYEKENLTKEDTAPASKWIKSKNGGHREYTEGVASTCFADNLGAKYYATKHNLTEKHNIPILITVDLNIANIAIDGRDFLYTVFCSIDPKNIGKTSRQAELLKKIFGYKIERYVEKIIKHPDSDKSAICDLAIVDDEIITEHLKNEMIIGGRYGTKFKSAFFGKAPISYSDIINVERISSTIIDPVPDITLNDILER